MAEEGVRAHCVCLFAMQHIWLIIHTYISLSCRLLYRSKMNVSNKKVRSHDHCKKIF